MPTQLTFRDVTLGYDRHPAVHHLSGEVASGALLVLIGAAPMALAQVNRNADPIIAQAIDGSTAPLDVAA